LIAVL